MSEAEKTNMLKKLRLQYKLPGGKRLTQRKLAMMAEISRFETISKIERGTQKVTAEQMVAFAKIFGVEPSIFVLGGGQGETAQHVAEEAELFVPDEESVESRFDLSPTQSWYRVIDSRLEEIGLVSGDAVIIDNAKAAISGVAIGDVLIASLYSADGKTLETIVRQWLPPHLLVTNSRKRNLPPLNTEEDNVSLLGLVIHPRRNHLRQKSFSSF